MGKHEHQVKLPVGSWSGADLACSVEGCTARIQISLGVVTVYDDPQGEAASQIIAAWKEIAEVLDGD